MLEEGDFPSQLQWKPYGHLICTPASLLMGGMLLQGREAPGWVRDVMQLSHNLYSDRFAASGLPLKIQELFPYIPRSLFRCTEVAGTVLGRSHQLKAEGLEIKPLLEVLRGMNAEALASGQRVCLVATARNHTTCFCADEGGRVYLFDPLPASLRALPLARLDEWLRQKYAADDDTQYSGLLLRLAL